MTEGESARRCAYGVLAEYGRDGAFLNFLLASSLASSELDRRDRALVTELVQGTVRMKGALDWALTRFSNRALDTLDPGVLWILRLSAYQIMFTEVPDYAACDLAAALARSELGESAVGYVNGVLRALARGLESIDWPDRNSDPLSYLEVRHSHPRWVVEMWVRELGFERAESLCAADNEQPSLSLRCNMVRTSPEELQADLQAQGMEVRRGQLAPEALLVSGSGSVPELSEYRRGLFSVQDQGSILVGRHVDPAPGMRVLDMCAAPGGKANHLAELMMNIGSVTALDVSPARLEMTDSAARRLGNTIVGTRALDSTTARAYLEGEFDRVLVDAPCTGLGTLARRPDTRWRKRPEDVERLSKLQLALLREGATLVKPGGLIVYSTCTISKRENRDVVDLFLQAESGFGPIEASGPRPGASGTFLELFRDTDGSDGMFAAVLRRAL